MRPKIETSTMDRTQLEETVAMLWNVVQELNDQKEVAEKEVHILRKDNAHLRVRRDGFQDLLHERHVEINALKDELTEAYLTGRILWAQLRTAQSVGVN